MSNANFSTDIIAWQRTAPAILMLAIAAMIQPVLIQPVLAEELKIPSMPAATPSKDAKAVRISSERTLELKKDRDAIDAEKATAAQMKPELEAAKRTLDAETADVNALEKEVATLRADLEARQLTTHANNSSEVKKFNLSAAEYNARATEASEKRTHLNASIVHYNELVEKYRAQTTVINQLAEAYNAKLARYGL